MLWGWLLLLVLLAGGPAWGFSLSANWQRTDTSSAPPSLVQNYTFSFSRELSSFMNFGGSVRFSRQSQAQTWRENWAPTLFFSLNNDLFNFSLSGSGTQSETDKTPTIKSYSWSANLGTSLRKISVNLFYNLSRNWNEINPRTVDSKNHGWGISLSRKFDQGFLKNLSILYDYRFSQNRDLVADSRSESEAHLMQASYSNTFHGLAFSISQQYSISESRAHYTLGPEGRAQVWIDLSFNGTPPSSITQGDEIVVIANREIQGLEFYSDWTNRILISASYRWDIYYSSDGKTWNLLPGASSVSLPYEFPFSLNYRFYKLKLVSGPLSPEVLPSPKFRGFYYVTTSHTKSRTTRYQGNLSLSYMFPFKIYSSYFASYELTTPERGASTSRWNHSLSASWNPNRYFQPQTTISYSLEDTEGEPLSKTLSFSFGVGSEPLDTINLSSAYTKTKHWLGGNATSQTDSYSFAAQMELYPDLILKTTLSYNRNQSFGNGTTTVRGYSASWDLLARLLPTVTADLRIDYSHSISRGQTSTSKRYSMSLNWRISDILFFSTTHTINQTDEETKYTYNYGFSLAPTSKLRLSTGWSGSRDGTANDSIGINLFWDLGPHMNLNSSYSWNRSGGETSWSWFVNFSLVF